MQSLGLEILDEDKTLLLLNSLFDLYEYLTTNLLHGKLEIKFADVFNALMNNEYVKLDKKVHLDSSSDALVQCSLKTRIKVEGEDIVRSL